MAVAVTRDLAVQVLQDSNAVKLADSKQALRAVVQRGEPKCLGVSQLMMGLMVMMYSIPLLLTPDYTEVLWLGVPWWSGAAFVIAGSVAIFLDKHCTMNNLYACLGTSVMSMVLSVAAVIIYSVDLQRNTEASCNNCGFKITLCRGVKAMLLLFTLAHVMISAVLCLLLFREKSSFQIYNPLPHDTVSTQATLTADEK